MLVEAGAVQFLHLATNTVCRGMYELRRRPGPVLTVRWQREIRPTYGPPAPPTNANDKTNQMKAPICTAWRYDILEIFVVRNQIFSLLDLGRHIAFYEVMLFAQGIQPARLHFASVLLAISRYGSNLHCDD